MDIQLDHLSAEQLIDLSMKINAELRNREYKLPDQLFDEQDVLFLESQLLK